MIWSNLTKHSREDFLSIVEGIIKGKLEYDFDDLKNVHAELVVRRLDSKLVDQIGDLMQDVAESTGGKAAAKIDTPKAPKKTIDPKPTRKASPQKENGKDRDTIVIPAIEEEPKWKRETYHTESIRVIQEEDLAPEPKKKKGRKKKRTAVIAEDKAALYEPDDRRYSALSMWAVFLKVVGWLLLTAGVGVFSVWVILFAGGDPIVIAAGIFATLLFGGIALLAFYAMAEAIEAKIEMIELLRRIRNYELRNDR